MSLKHSVRVRILRIHFKEFVIFLFYYICITIFVYLALYSIAEETCSHESNFKYSIVCAILWPIIIGMVIAMILFMAIKRIYELN